MNLRLILEKLPWLAGLLFVSNAFCQDEQNSCAPEVSIVVEQVSRIVDPKLSSGGAVILFSTEPAGTKSEVVVEVVDPATSTVLKEVIKKEVEGGTKERHVWDGKDEDGKFVDPGLYQVRISNSTDQKMASLSVVRLGITEVQSLASADDADDVFPLVYFYYYDEAPAEGDASPRETLTFDRTPTIEYRNAANPDDISDLDLDTGEPRAIPPLHTDVHRPLLDDDNFLTENTYNYPRCHKMGTRPRFRVTMGTGATSLSTGAATGVGAGYPITGFDLRLTVTAAGATQTSPALTDGPGGSVVVQGPLLPGEIKRVDDFQDTPLEFCWEYQETGTPSPSWVEIPGSVFIPMRFYTILDTPNFPAGMRDTPYQGPWITVADLWHQWNVHRPDGAIEINSAALCIENHLHGLFRKQFTAGPLHSLVYQGSPRYLKGSNRDPSWPNMNLASLLALREGPGVNCADCMGMTISMLSMMGVPDVRGMLLFGTGACGGKTDKIALEATRPLGSAVLTSSTDPTCFGFHYVATRDAGMTVIDGSVQLEDITFSTWDDEREFGEYANKLSTSPSLTKDLSAVDSIPFLDGYLPPPDPSP